MSHGFNAVCDDFYASCRLFLKLDMGLERESVLHFFDRVRKEFPALTKMRRRDEGGLVLEEEPRDGDGRRWMRLDRDSLRFGVFSPTSMEDVRRFGEFILEQAPYHLTFSEIDFEHLEVIYGFDLEYRGNHDQLVAETFLSDQTSGGFLFGDEAAHVIDAQPYYGIALTPECDLQAYVEVKSRTTTYEIRSTSYENEPISVVLTLRKYWGVSPSVSPAQAFATLAQTADDLANDKVVPNLVNPLAAAIASRS